ncbi:MAG: hypothetical protein NTX50_24595 [Candidatus Sumerlaeota bacterium]|nr:hypothetical protein [Candidatus Sumerlaeota bacterium]
MKCPKCGNAVLLSQRICPHCKYFAEQDRFVEIAPEVAPRRRPPRFLSWLARWRLGRKTREEKQRAMAPARGAFFAEFIPGFGQFLSGRWLRGAIILASVVGLCAIGVLRKGELGYMMFGLAASLHAWSILNVSPVKNKNYLAVRTLVIAFSIILLLSFVYRPIAQLLIGSADRTIMVPAALPEAFRCLYNVGNLIVFVCCGISAWVIAIFSGMMITFFRRLLRR